MKKNKIMRIASVLLVAVLLSTSIISGTFAKYVTSDSVTDSARVAKFGVVVVGSGSLFDRNYFYVTEGNLPFSSYRTEAQDPADEGVRTLTVESSNADKLVAPGTKSPNEGMTISVTGKPEVDVQLTLDLTVENDVYLQAGTYPDMTTGKTGDTFTLDGDYYPVVYTLTRNGGPAVTGTIADVKAYLENLIAGTDNGYYNANTDLGNVIGELKLTWNWAFEGEQTIGGNYFSEVQVNQADTLLGDLIANQLGATANAEVAQVATTSYNLNTGISIAITVTQVD